MPVSLNNSKDIIANSISVIKGNRTIDVVETIDAVQGLAPDTLNSLEKLASAMNNDSNYFQTVTTAISNKADTATTYTKSVVDGLLDAKVDDTEMTNYATKATTYTKSDVDAKFTNIINGAPDALNTLKELSDALGSNPNFSTTILSQIGSKANTADTFLKTTVGVNRILDFSNDYRLTAGSGAVKVQKLDNDGAIVTDSWVDVATFNFNTNSNTSSLVMNGTDILQSLSSKANATDVTTTLATKANTTDVYSKTAMDQILGSKSGVFNVQGPLTFLTDPQNPQIVTLDADVYSKTAVDGLLAAKAPKANPAFTGAVTADTVTATTVAGGHFESLSGYLKTPTLKFPGTDATNNLVIVNTLGSEIARFYNDYRCQFNGNTTILGDATVAGALSVAGGITGLAKSSVSLGNVDDTSDLNKPLSTATINALALKAPATSPAFTGTVSADIITATSVNATTLTAGQIESTSGYLKTPTLKFPGTDANSNLVIQNSLGSEVARFYNDYRCRLNGNTTILGDATVSGALSVAGPVTLSQTLQVGGDLETSAGKITASVVKTSGTPGLKIQNNSGTTDIVKFWDSGTTNFYGNVIGGGNITASGSRQEVQVNINNAQNDAFSCLYFNNTSAGSQPETAQLYCGQSSGLVIATNTAHPIRLSANRNIAPTTPSIEIQPTGNKNVVINSPLIYKPYASLLVTTTSGVVSVTNFGYCNLTASSVTRVGTGSKGYTITFPAAHPSGANFAVFATAQTSASTTWDGTNDFIVTAKVESGGAGVSVWCRRPGISGATASGFTDGSFYIHTVP